MLPAFIAALRATPPEFAPGLRVKRVQGGPGVWQGTSAPDGRATFSYDEEIRPGEPLGSGGGGPHDVLRHP